MKPTVLGIAKPQIMAGIAFFSLLAALFFISGCSTDPPDSKPDLTSKVQSITDTLAEFTPPGWEIFDKVKIFTAENLYQHINGRAELYLAYDVKNLTAATLENKSDIGKFIELSIYDMNTPTNAFGIFSVERFQDEPALDLGRKSYSSDSSIFIWQGNHYITIVTSDTSGEIRKLSLDLARNVTALFTDSGEPVWGFTALPQKNRVPDSVKYFKVDALGLDFLPNTFTASYRRTGVEITVFLSKQNSPDEAQDCVERYSEFAKRYGRGSQSLTREGIELIVCDMDGSFDVVFRIDRLVGGVQSVVHRSTALEATVELWKHIDRE